MLRICPNCNQPMEDNSFNYYGIGDWDMDYPANHCELHICKNCLIEYTEGEWKIPDKYQATEKQKRTILFITSVLDIDPPPLTKREAWKFISEFFDEAKRVKQIKRYSIYDEECLEGDWW